MAYVNSQQPRIDAWIQPGCRADIAVVSTESWPVDTVVTIGVADAAGVIAVPLLTITPDLATLTATVALTGVQVAALAVACPPPYGVIDWQWRTGAGSPLGVGSLHWDLTGARTTQTVTVMMGPAGPGATPEAISALVEDYLVAHPPTGSGDVTGPASAVAGNLPVLDVTGKVLSDSGYDPTDFASAGHNHAGVYDAAGTAAGLVGAITPGSIGAAPALSPDDNYVTDAEKSALHTHPAVIAQGVTQADARAAIGAGTSSLVIGTGAGDAKAGNYAPDLSGLVPKSLVDAKGDMIVATAADTVARLPVGATTGHVLTIDPAEASGIKWAAPSGAWVPNTLPGHIGIPGESITSAATNDASATGILYMTPFIIPVRQVIDSIAVVVNVAGTAGSTGRQGLYRMTTAGTWELITDAGTFALDSTGTKTASLAYTANPGLYGAAVMVSASCTLTCPTTRSAIAGQQGIGQANVRVRVQESVTYGPMPATSAATGYSGSSSTFNRSWITMGAYA